MYLDVNHAAQNIRLGRVGSLLEALPDPWLTAGAHLRIEQFLMFSEFVVPALAFGIVGVFGVGEVLGKASAQEVLVLETCCAKRGP